MRNKRGITLIALVLTIIVMSILAGVSFNALVGDNGILTSAADSKMKYEEEHAKEQLEMAWSARMSKYLENITNPPVFIDDKEIAEFMKQLNAELVGNGKIEGLSWDDQKNAYSILFRNNAGQLFYMSVTPAGNVIDRALQGNQKKNVSDTMYSSNNYVVNESNVEEKANTVRNDNIYAFLYKETNYQDYYVLVLNNENVGVDNPDYRFVKSWNSINDNFNFRHDATQERINESQEDVNPWEYSLWKDYNIQEVEILNPIYPEHLDYFFAGNNLSEIRNIENLFTTNTTSMKGMFESTTLMDCTLDLSNFQTAKVTDMSEMFMWFDMTDSDSDDDMMNLNLSDLNTAKVTDMSYMFDNLQITVSGLNFNTSKVTDMSFMFRSYPGRNLDVSSFDTSKVTNMNSMFYDCAKLTRLNLSNFDTSNVTNMNEMFDGDVKLTSLDVFSFNTSKVTNMSSMFMDCKRLTSLDVSSFDTSKVEDMDGMFYACESLTTLDLRNFSLASIDSFEKIMYMFMDSKILETVIVTEAFRIDADDGFGDILGRTATNNYLTIPVMYNGEEKHVYVDVENFFLYEYDYNNVFSVISPNSDGKIIFDPSEYVDE